MLPGPRDLIRHWAQADAERPAVVTVAGTLGYAELADRVAAVAARLRGLGVGPGVRVGLAFPNSLDYLIWLFGLFEAGGVAVPLDPRMGAPELATAAATASLRFIAATALPVTLPWPPMPAVSAVAGGLWQCRGDGRGSPSETTGNVLVQQFTSGSGGRPKHIQRTEAQIREDYRHFSAGLGLDGGTRFLAPSPFYHAYGALGMYATLAVGGAIFPLPRFIPAELMAAAKRFQPTLTMVTPTMIDMLGKCFLPPQDRGVFASLRHCICSTGHLSQAAHDAFRGRFDVPVHEQYGSTETLSATVNLGDDFDEGCVGRPYPGVEVAIFDSQGAMSAPLVVGSVGIRSSSVCVGYAEADHALATVDGYVLPGDKGFLDETGRLHILGRDDVYNVGGYKVDRSEVELAIRRAFPVTYVAVLPFERAGQPALCAVVEASSQQVTPESVMAACRAQLLAYKVPARVVVKSSLPREANGKVRVGDLASVVLGKE
ncbi:class I adenylate-forming enzyme family protein [Parasulfuritortus cantonensis]|nr:class I adenylate-forming enzyme family protein [Parasulfuritortus cantonensis]